MHLLLKNYVCRKEESSDLRHTYGEAYIKQVKLVLCKLSAIKTNQ